MIAEGFEWYALIKSITIVIFAEILIVCSMRRCGIRWFNKNISG
jgi:hypothetical protein